MQILSLRLDNVKSYRFLELDFAPGANVVAGHNGAGKSTILEAIGFTLFDSLPYNQRDFVREGEKSAAVTVTFVSSEDERPYEVQRKCGGANAYVVTDPETGLKQCEGKADVQRFLRLHLGVDPGASLDKLFSDAVGVPQGTFTAAFHLRPSERKGVFDPLLQVDEYDTAWSRLREPFNLLRDRLQEIDLRVAGLAGRLEQLPILEVSVLERRKRLETLAGEVSKLDAELATVREQKSELDAANAEIRALDDRVRATEKELAAGRAQLDSAQAALAEARDAQTAVEQHQPAYDAYTAAQTRQKELEGRTKERRALLDQRAELDKNTSLARSELQKIEEDLAAVTAAEKAASELGSLAGEQMRLDKVLVEAREQHATLNNLRSDETRLMAEMQKLESRCRTLQNQMFEQQNKETERSELEAQISTCETAVSTAEQNMAEHRVRADTIKQQNELLQSSTDAYCPICRQQLTTEHREAVLAGNEEALTEMRCEYADAQKRAKTETSRLQSLRATRKEVEQSLRRMPRASELSDAQETLEATRTSLTQVARRIAGLQETPREIEEIENSLTQLGNPRQQLAVVQATVARRPQLETGRKKVADRQEEAAARLAEIDDALNAFTQLDEQIAMITADLDKHTPGYQALLSHRRLASTVDQRQDAVTTLSQSVGSLDKERVDLETQLTETRAGFDAEAYARALTREAELVGILGGLRTETRMLTEAQQQEEERLDKLRRQQTELVEQQTQRARLQRQSDVLEDMRSILRQAGPYITQALIRQISENAAQIFGELMQDFTRHLVWQEEYSIALDVEGNLRQFGQLSGGEQMSAALAVRLALLRELSSIDIAFFDEPTTNLDAARRDALAQQILKLDGLRQLFVISHDDTFEQATERLIRVERVDGVSRVSE